MIKRSTCVIENESGQAKSASTSPESRLQEVDGLLAAQSTANGRFPKWLEDDFRRDMAEARVRHFVIVGVFGIFFYDSFVLTDWFLFRDIFIIIFITQLLIVSPIVIFCLYLIAKRITRPELNLTFSLTIIFASVIYFYTKSNSQYTYLLIFTVPLCLSYGSIILPLPFRLSALFTGFCISISSAAVFARPDWVPVRDLFILLTNANTGAYMLFATFRMEANERRAYLVNLRKKLHADILDAKLNQQQALLQSILDTGPDAMILFDGQGTIASFSRAAEQMFGWHARAVVGQDIRILMTESSRAEHERHLKGQSDSHDLRMMNKSSELDGRRQDGSVFPMILHIGEVPFGDKRQFTGIIHDLTQLREAHHRSQDLRTQLVHVWSMNSLGEMAAVLAHELNQPLSAIANYMQGTRTILSHQKEPDQDVLEAVDQAGAQALRASEIIRRMRSLIARKDSHHREESLKELISEIDFMIRLVAREADVTVLYDFSPKPDLVYVDRIQIQQVVSNLARNACEAMHGHVQRILDISTRSDGRSWSVSVDDSGPGIAPEISEKLFVPLATSKTQGMGLGLTVSRAIIRHHNGELWVGTSRRGGSSFGFTIPISSTK